MRARESVIVANPDVDRTYRGPSKHDSPLVIDADAVASRKVAREQFQTIAGRRTQIGQQRGIMHHVQLAPNDRRNIPPSSIFPDPSMNEKILRGGIGK